MILAIETATRNCSVALFNETGMIALLEADEDNSHSAILHVLIDRLLKEKGIEVKDLQAVAVSKGPGSYTGLRIGVSAAKGLCYAQDIPLIAVNSLESMAAGMRDVLQKNGESHKNTLLENTLLLPMIDARRMEVYSAVFDMNLQPVRETEAEVITAESFEELRIANTLYLAGDGADKCKEVLNGNSIQYLDGFNASAAFMMHAAMVAFNKQQFENVAYFEPFYLKDFIAGKPRVKGL